MLLSQNLLPSNPVHHGTTAEHCLFLYTRRVAPVFGHFSLTHPARAGSNLNGHCDWTSEPPAGFNCVPSREYWIAGAQEEIQSLKDLQAYVLSLFPLADPWLYKLELCTTHRARYQCGHHALLSSRLCYRDCPRRIHHL
jgi:hypothetical protein